MVGHNSCPDWARESVKTFLDAENNKEFNECEKKARLHLKFLRKIHIFEFAVLIFWHFLEKIKKNSFPASPFAFRSCFCASTTPEEPNNTIFPKYESELNWGKICGCTWASAEIFPGRQRRHFAYPFHSADGAMHTDFQKTLYPFCSTSKMPRQQSQK